MMGQVPCSAIRSSMVSSSNVTSMAPFFVEPIALHSAFPYSNALPEASWATPTKEGKPSPRRNICLTPSPIMRGAAITTSTNAGGTIFLNVMLYAEAKLTILPGSRPGAICSLKIAGAYSSGSSMKIMSASFDASSIGLTVKPSSSACS